MGTLEDLSMDTEAANVGVEGPLPHHVQPISLVGKVKTHWSSILVSMLAEPSLLACLLSLLCSQGSSTQMMALVLILSHHRPAGHHFLLFSTSKFLA